MARAVQTMHPLPLTEENMDFRPPSRLAPELWMRAPSSRDSSLGSGSPPPGSFREACAWHSRAWWTASPWLLGAVTAKLKP